MYSVVGGVHGDGVYPKGEILLPIHVQCMCYKVAIQEDADVFADRMRGWLTGEQPWAAMDEYAASLGLEQNPTRVAEPGLLVSWGSTLVTWLWGNQEGLTGVLGI